MTSPLLLDHSIVGAQDLTNFTFNKEREWAGCRLCGAVFQAPYNRISTTPETYYANPDKIIEAAQQTSAWREKHNKTHTETERRQLALSGRSYTPEAAHKLAPFGLVSLVEATHDPTDEFTRALFEAPRAPVDDGESKGTR